MNFGLVYLIGLLVVILLVVSFLLRKRKGKDSSKISKAVGTIFFHEDEYCQVQLLPSENYPDLIEEVKTIKEFSKNSSNNNGWSETKVREENKVKICDREILSKSLDEILSKLKSIKHSVVITGYGENHRVLSKNTTGFGEDNIAIYYNTKKGIVQNIWMTNVSSFNVSKATQVLSEISEKWDLVLMDWNSLELVDLKNKDQVESYLN